MPPRPGFWLMALLCCGCSGTQSALAPQGPVADRLGVLLFGFTGVLGAVWLLVLLLLGVALRRPPATPNTQGESRAGRVVLLASIATAAIVAGLSFASYLTTRSISMAGDEALVIRVRAYQWWWKVTYPTGEPFETANEIHLPIGRPVRLELEADDVIHSFWVPNLAGKQDMIPGRANHLVVVADQAGSYRGQCAEFCGLQHARMALVVIAEPAEAFERWQAAQRAVARYTDAPGLAAGRVVFENGPCGACHTVRGTSAQGTAGPDLTHLASRSSIAAGVLPMTRGALAAWIADPQTIKPGNNMPMVPLSAQDLQAVTAWLMELR